MSSEGRAVKQAKSAVENNIDKASEKATTLKDKVADNVSNIADKVHQGTDAGKEFLNNSAEKVNNLAHKALDKAGDIGQRAADAVENSTDYIKNLDIEDAKKSVKVAVKENPEIVLVTVGILGLAVGYLLGKRNA